jgi:hypothetical protein
LIIDESFACMPDVLFFTNGKPWKMARPGQGDAADALVRAAGGDDVNLVQQAYYNGHYGLLVERCSMCCREMACATLLHSHCIIMYKWMNLT